MTLHFQVKHKEKYKLRMRMGIHSGALIGSVVGVKMPHFSVFGETVYRNIMKFISKAISNFMAIFAIHTKAPHDIRFNSAEHGPDYGINF